MRGSNTVELVFEGVDVPSEHVLGEEVKGARVLISGLDDERVALSGVSCGIMASCLDEIMGRDLMGSMNSCRFRCQTFRLDQRPSGPNR